MFVSTHPGNSGPWGVGSATIEILRPCPDPLIRVLGVFEAARVYMAAQLDRAEQLVQLVSAELWSADIQIEALPPLPDAA